MLLTKDDSYFLSPLSGCFARPCGPGAVAPDGQTGSTGAGAEQRIAARSSSGGQARDHLASQTLRLSYDLLVLRPLANLRIAIESFLQKPQSRSRSPPAALRLLD